MSILAWIGARARWIMAAGVVAALFMPAVSALLRPFLPAFVVLVFAIAVARLDLRPAVRRAATAKGAARLALWIAAFLAATPAILWAAGHALGLSEGEIAALVYTGAAPPITSSAAICLMLGLNGLFALEMTVVASALTPLVGPVVARLLLGEAVPLDVLTLGLRTGAMILLGTILGLWLRRAIGAERIRDNARVFDGIAAITMITFIIPLFDGVGEMLIADPWQGFRIFTLAVAVNFGMQILAVAAVARAFGPGEAGAAGFMWGNRTVAIYLAALPPDPLFTLYVALYQVPMLFTPLLMRRVLSR
jgi:predicted Na+-dependent transporter